MRPSQVLYAKRDAIRELAERRHLSNVRVFGSVLHDNDTEGSDVDLLVDPAPHTTLFDLVALEIEVAELLGVPVDLLTPKFLPESFREQVVREAKPL